MRRAALTRLPFNSARAWFQRGVSHKGRDVVNAVVGNIPSAAGALGLGEGGAGRWSPEQVPGEGRTRPGSPSHVFAPSSPTVPCLCAAKAHGRCHCFTN